MRMLMTLKDIAELTGHSPGALRTMAWRGQFIDPDERIGTACLYQRGKVTHWRRDLEAARRTPRKRGKVTS